MKRTILSLTLLLALVLSAACQPAASTPTAAPKATTAAAATTAPASAATQAPAAPAAKTDYPNKPITILVPYPAGGMNDMNSRLVAPMLEKELGVPVVVENKSGAGGQVGWREAAKSKADGYTIASIALPHLPAATLDKERKADFTAQDLVPFITQVLDPTVVSVLADSKWKTLKELMDDAKANPNKIRAGIVGYLNDDEIGYLQLAEATGTEMRKVFFDGAAPAMTALLGNNVDVLYSTLGDNNAQVKAGKVRVLGVMDSQRPKLMPDAPTVDEAGYKGIYSSSTRGYAVPKGTPPEVIARLTAAFEKVMNTKEHNEKMEAAANSVRILKGPDLDKFYLESIAVAQKWVDKVVR